MVPESGHVTVTKIENLHIEKFTDSKDAIPFDRRRKIAENPFQNSGATRRSRLELTLVINTSF